MCFLVGKDQSVVSAVSIVYITKEIKSILEMF